MSYTSKYTGAEIDARLDKMLNVTWQELKDLRDAGNLIAGQMYRMTDYETMTSQAGTQSAGHPFDLVLTALDNKTLSEECSAIQSARDTDGYFANSNLSAWKVWYCLDNDMNRFGWAAMKGMTWEQEGVTLNFGYYGPYTWNDAEYYAYRCDYGSLVGMGTTIWLYALYSTSTPSVGDTATYVLLDGTPIGRDIQDATSYMNVPILSISTINGKGVIYRMIDEWNNDVCYDFKNIQSIATNDNYQYTFPAGYSTDATVVGVAKNNLITPFIYNKIFKIPNICFNYEFTGFPRPTFNNRIINCEKVHVYLSDGGEFNNLTFENCDISKIGSGGGNYSIKFTGCTIRNCSGDLIFDTTKKRFINCNIEGVNNTTLYGRESAAISTLLYIRAKSDGTVFTYTEDDIYNLLNPTS